MGYSTISPNINNNIRGVGGFWEEFGSGLSTNLGFTPAPEANLTNTQAPPYDTELQASNIVQDAQDADGMGSFLGNLFGDVLSGAANYGIGQLFPQQPTYQTQPDGSIQPAQPQPSTQPESSGAPTAAIGAGVLVALGVGAYLLFS